jgi:hypothetical protein
MPRNGMRTIIRTAAVVCAMAVVSHVDAAAQADAAAARPHSGVAITVYKNASCGCCQNWVEHLRQHGFHVVTHDVSDTQPVKAEHGVPSALASCHTALVAGYFIEGHVPADVIQQLIDERPPVVGLAVPGMPIGSPGMEMEGREPQPYEILAFMRDGTTTVFARR